MKTIFTVDLKSLVMGAAGAAVLIFATGATSGSGTLGHYQVSVGGDGRTAILDTMSGQCWTGAISSNGETSAPDTFFLKRKDNVENPVEPVNSSK